MKIKLIVLLTLCLALFVASVQAQNNVLGNMEDIDVVITGNVTETITSQITGNAAIVEEMEFADNMSDDAGNMTNATNNTNISENMTLDVTGKIILIKDLGNMTEKVVVVGRAESIPGNVVIFGETDNMTEGMANATGNMTDAAGNMTNGNMTDAAGDTANAADNMTNVTDNMANATDNMTNATGNMTSVAENMTIITTGNMTGTIMFNAAGGAGNATGISNMSDSIGNMTVSMAGNMTGNLTGDMTRRTVVIKNISDTTEMSEKLGNVTEMGTGMANTTEPMELNLTGNMVIIKNMDDMPEMDEEDIDDLIAMDGNTAIIGTMDNLTEMEEDAEATDNVTKKIVAVRSVDNMIRIMTWDFICNMTQSMVEIEDIGAMVENMTSMTGNVTGNQTGNVTDNMTGNMTGNVTDNMTGNMTGDVTGGMTGNMTDNMTGNMTGDTTGNMTGNQTDNMTGNMTGNVTNVPLVLESIEDIENDTETDYTWLVYINGEPAEQEFGMNDVTEGDILSFWYTTEEDGEAVIEEAIYAVNIMIGDETEGQENVNADLTVLYDDAVNLTEGTFTFTPEGSDQEYELNNFTDIGALNATGLEFVASVMDDMEDNMTEDNADENGTTGDMTEDDTTTDDTTGTTVENTADTTADDTTGDDDTNNDM